MEIQCKHCGATLHYEPGTTSLVCEYCGSRTDINEEGAAKAQTPTASYIVPFALDRDGAITAARSYMAAGSTTPDDLTTRAEILNVSFVYVPAWDCSGSYTTHWNASFGYDRQETRRVYSNLNKRWETQTHTVTDWTPHSGTIQDSFRFCCPAFSNKGLRLGEEIAAVAFRTSLSACRAFDEGYINDVDVIPFQKDPSQAFGYAGAALQNTISAQVHANKLGDRQKDWHWNTDYQHNPAESVFVPVAIVDYRYQGKDYSAVINGHSGRDFRGELPVDLKKVSLAAEAQKHTRLAMVPFYLAAIASVAQMILRNDYSIFSGMVLAGLAISLIFGFLVRRHVKQEMQKFEETSEKIRRANLIRAESADAKIDLSDARTAQIVAESQKTIAPYSPRVHLSYGLYVAAAVVSLFLCASPVSGLFGSGAPAVQTASAPEASSANRSGSEGAVSPQRAQAAQAPTSGRPLLEGTISGSAKQTAQVVLDFLTQNTYTRETARDFFAMVAQLPRPAAGDKASSNRYNQEGVKAYNAGRYPQAVDGFARAIAADPSDAVLYGNLAVAQINAGKNGLALPNMLMAVALDSGNKDYWAILQSLCVGSGNNRCASNASVLAAALPQ
ncbi:MAG TPA: hypothetical protein IAC66_03360 [Candidatus Aphodousia gallistercoris]|nr:hypothetical protein [Candidatus Aphodousia gallistercoris]